MKKVCAIIFLIIVLISTVFILSGCTLQIETTNSSVSASVDEDTTEKVDGVIDWIKARLKRLFNTDKESDTDKESYVV